MKKKLPNTTGFSSQNLRYIESFYILYRKIFQQVAGKLITKQRKGENLNNEEELNNPFSLIASIPWGHHIVIIDKYKNNPKAAWFYVNKIVQNNWSRTTLENYVDSKLYEREEKSVNNFSATLSNISNNSIAQLSKDPFYFDFAELRDDYNEKELKKTLVDHIKDFLLELGTGFSFVGQEYRLHVGESDFYIDLLFYHIPSHAYVVVEIKTTQFKPEYLGQLNFYIAAVNRDIKGKDDNETIGLLICRDKDRIVAQYSLDNFKVPLGISSYDLSKLISEKVDNRLPTVNELEHHIKKD